MHVVLALLGSIVTIFYILDRLGIDVGGLNPFYWYRRRTFARNYGSDPIYSIDDPMHIAALLILGAAKLDGDLTTEQKSRAKALFESRFSISAREASELFGSAAHLLAAPQLLETQLTKLVERNTERFSPEQARSLIDMMHEVASAGGQSSPQQQSFISLIRSRCVKDELPQGTWS